LPGWPQRRFAPVGIRPGGFVSRHEIRSLRRTRAVITALNGSAYAGSKARQPSSATSASNGAEQVAIRARDLGNEVIYEGIRLTPARMLQAQGSRRRRGITPKDYELTAMLECPSRPGPPTRTAAADPAAPRPHAPGDGRPPAPTTVSHRTPAPAHLPRWVRGIRRTPRARPATTRPSSRRPWRPRWRQASGSRRTRLPAAAPPGRPSPRRGRATTASVPEARSVGSRPRRRP
jgi:hypothetical protein